MIKQEIVIEQVDREAADALDDALGFLTEVERPIVLAAFARHRASSAPEAAVAGEVERLRERIGREAKDWRHNAYTRVMLAEMHDRLAVLAQGGEVHG